MDNKEKHEKMLYPAVRVRTGTAGGSGTVIYSELVPGEEEEHETYVLTNNHVIKGNVKVETKYDGMLGRDVKKDVRTPVNVEFFDWEYKSWTGGVRGITADIAAYSDEDTDLALLKLKTMKKAEFIGKLFPRGEEKKRLRFFTDVCAVGCGMGHPPVATFGSLNGFDDIIDNQPYFCSSAPTIYGNSGGSLYLADTGELIGVPARITVAGSMFGGGSPISHLSYSIQISTIYKFLEDEMYNFIFDPETDSKQCAENRNKKREREDRLSEADAKK